MKEKVINSQGEELDFEFERVDFERPETIIHYGHEAKDEIVKLFKSISASSNEYEELSLDEETVANIESFNDVLEESDKQLEKKRKSLGFKTKKLLTKLGVKGLDISENSNSYKEQYEEYLKKIDKSREIVESLKVGAMEDAKTRKELASVILPYLDVLKYIIEVGKKDRVTFAEQVEAEKEELNKLKTDPTLYDEQKVLDKEHSIQLHFQFLGLFEDRLNDLNKNLIVYKEERQGLLLQQTNEFQILLSAEAYLKDVTTVLETQASIHIFNRKQERRIQIVDKLTKAGNNALKRDAELLQQNVQDVANLALNTGIYTSTTEALHTTLHESLSLYIQGREAKTAQIISDQKTIEAINASIDEDIKAISYIDGELSVVAGSLEDKRSAGFQKKLTFKKKK